MRDIGFTQDCDFVRPWQLKGTKAKCPSRLGNKWVSHSPQTETERGENEAKRACKGESKVPPRFLED